MKNSGGVGGGCRHIINQRGGEIYFLFVVGCFLELSCHGCPQIPNDDIRIDMKFYYMSFISSKTISAIYSHPESFSI